jgi:hypothetical protein
MPLMTGLMNLVVPLQIGACDEGAQFFQSVHDYPDIRTSEMYDERIITIPQK